MKNNRIRIKNAYTGNTLQGFAAECYIAVMKARAAQREADETLKVEIKRKAAELKTAAELRAAKEHTTTAERKAATVRYRAEARERAATYKEKLERKQRATYGSSLKVIRLAAERKIDGLLREAISGQNGLGGHIDLYLWMLGRHLTDRLNEIGVR